MDNTTTLCTKINSDSEKSKITRELLNGHEAATQLKLLLLKNPNGGSSLSAEELLANVLRSFNEILSILSSQNAGIKAADDSDQCKNKRTATKTARGRGCYKRRSSAHTWTIVSLTADDNYTWRKYGQKQILSSIFPRSYFRCSRKHEGCRAIKQVQKTQENPIMYQTTYTGMHTCKSTPNSNNNVPRLLVNSQNHHHEKDYYPIISPLTPTVTQEHAKEDSPSHVGDHKLDHVWSDLKDFEPSIKPSINLVKNFGTHDDDEFHHFDAFLAS
ncbi:probable WRKY transcription factor 70 [Arachis stenosperma]|uniref:probable WRKY transcription factor 70 n=1 Tax=Arachis stenosperma TaxID=217475 RepID=UPI0025AC4493|nr:probable WRKY transcription factor 70 [Arachis stenosperma]